MERRPDQSKHQLNSLSPSRSTSTSITLDRSKYLRSEVEHPSPKSPSETQPILSPDFHQNPPEVHYFIENLERVSISTEKPKTSQTSKIIVSSSLQPKQILTQLETQKT